jgi:hypothetical protein
MLILTRKRTQRIAVFLDGNFVGWLSVEEIRRQHNRNDQARLGMSEFSQSFNFVREEILSDDLERLTRAAPPG